jgi:hypothetical protein
MEPGSDRAIVSSYFKGRLLLLASVLFENRVRKVAGIAQTAVATIPFRGADTVSPPR